MTMNLRAREIGVPFGGEPGPFNAITDVAGVEVGHKTLIVDSVPGGVTPGRVRTGVTIIHPRGRLASGGVAAGRAVINGTGEWTGMHMVDEIGRLFGPIALTGTGNLGLVHQAIVEWTARLVGLHEEERVMRLLPAVGETLDFMLHDVFGQTMRTQDVFEALDGAALGPVDEGNVGGGVGMVAYYFKGGIGSSSRVIQVGGETYTVGTLLQANHGRRTDLRIAGVPIGEEICDLQPEIVALPGSSSNWSDASSETKTSLLIVLATDAPLQAHQLRRLARRASLGVGRNGSTASNLSGEFALAFSTTNVQSYDRTERSPGTIDDGDSETMNALFAATVQSVEEALVNQLVASKTLTGVNGNRVHGLPLDRLRTTLAKYNRLNVASS